MQSILGFFGGTSTADEPGASQNSTDSGTHDILIEDEKPAAEQLEILQDDEDIGLTEECYFVLLADGSSKWLCVEHIDERPLSEWNAFKAKRRKVIKATQELEVAKEATISTTSVNIVWRNSLQHKKALVYDGRMTEDAYPGTVKLNGHNVVRSCAQMPGIVVNCLTVDAAKQDIERAIDRAMDGLPAGERPEMCGPAGLGDDIGQTHKKIDVRVNNDAYGRMYLRKPPEVSNKGKKRLERGEVQHNKARGGRYTDEVAKTVGFLGIALGRRALLPHAVLLLNHAEEYAQRVYARRAAIQPQSSEPSSGCVGEHETCRDCLLVLYRVVFASPAGRLAYKQR